MIPILSPTPGEPFVDITHGSDSFRLMCAEAFGIGALPYHATPDGQHYAGVGEWEVGENALFMHRVISAWPAITYDLMIEALDGKIEIAFTARNKSGAAWAWPSWADFCFQHDPFITGSTDLYDADGTRTYIPRPTGMLTAASQAAAQIAASNTAHFYLPGITNQYPECVGCLIARSNIAGNKWTGFYFEGSPGLFANFGQANCTHASPLIGPLPAGAAMTCRGRITFDQTTLSGVAANTPVAA